MLLARYASGFVSDPLQFKTIMRLSVCETGKPQGKRFSFMMPLRGSRSSFNGSDPALDPASPPALERVIYVSIPASYRDGDAAPVLIVQDGGDGDHVDWENKIKTGPTVFRATSKGRSRRSRPSSLFRSPTAAARSAVSSAHINLETTALSFSFWYPCGVARACAFRQT